MRPARAMVLAAGLGLRMRPLTATTPKPLIAAGGRTMLDRALDHLEAFGIEQVVVNSHYLGEQIAAHVAARGRPPMTLSPEDTLLETGGGVVKALPLLGSAPFFVVNADIVWVDGPTPALDRLAAAWDDARMDALLLMNRTVTAFGYAGQGDYGMDPNGLLRRRQEATAAPYVFTGVQILHPRLLDSAPDGPFSLNRLYDAAERRGRLYGIVHDGEWFHIGTPDGLKTAEDRLLGRPGAHDFHVG